MSSPAVERRIGLRRARSLSPSNQIHREKRQRTSRQASFSPPLLVNRPNSASSSAASIGQYYGVGDEDTLSNLFASYPQTFSTFPLPHGSQGLHEPAWDLRFDYEIHLLNEFPSGRTRLQRVRAPIPGPEIDPAPFSSPPEPAQRPPTATRAEFESAMKIVRQVVGEDQRLTIDLARSYERVRAWRERWGWSPLSSDAYESPPPYSPPRKSPTQILQVSPRAESPESLPFQQISSPSPGPIPNPPIPGDPAPLAEALFDSVNLFAKENGFGIVRRNAYSYKGRRIRYSLQCDRFGQPGASKGAGLRQRKSRKCGCKWMVIAEALEEGKWLLRQHPNLEHSQHNHGPSITSSAHPSHRRLTTPVRATIESTSRRVGIRARDVRAVIEEQHPESSFTQRDIYNARALINREKLNGYTPTAALIKLLDEMEIPYLVKWADDQPNRLLGLVWTFPYCIQMWKRFPEVISFDNTYNTNRFKLPLFQATGQTCLGTVFNAAFGLIDNERREGFQFLAESIRQLIDQHSIRQPDVIITDFDDSMKAALNDQFPDVQQQLCIYHINSNVLLKSKQKWAKKRKSSSSPDASDWEDSAPQTQAELSVTNKQLVHSLTGDEIPHTYRGVLMMWKRVLFAETEEVHEKAWRDLCKKFDDQRVILRYLHGTYLPVRAQWARCFLRKHRNFGIRVTSGTEASNNNIKSYLLNGMSHLYRLVEAMQDMMKDQERDFKDACAQDEVLTAREYLGSSGDYLGDLPTVISSKALGLINKQYRIARKAMPTGKNPFPEPLSDCNDDCSVSVELGVPWGHKVYAKLGSATSFTRYDVHPRWRLRDSSSQDPYRRILDPRIATALRGRPKNTAQPVPSRMAIGGSSQTVSQLTSLAASQPAGRKRGRPPRIVNKSTLTRVSLEPSQHSNTQANSEPPSDLDEQQEFVLAVGGRNLASGGRGVNGN
ncbi:hypothetical protein HZS61_002355 [Fusarium oxysporum f. sp. conglutinans]|uniref:MULE transposase domain-containing protein n=2 Tax=Fusarium oxysporum TaxID=5507 RepID=A0A8H6GHG0_FUSOX|nr:hypothetical protein HZS61_002355 [Fusarium oxysporum f. sp. conglutinans]